MSDGIIKDETEASSSSGLNGQSGKVMLAALILTAIALVSLFTYTVSLERERLEEGVRSQLTS